MNRRELLLGSGAVAAALGLARFPLGWAAEGNQPKRRILMFTRSEGFEHSVVKRPDKAQKALSLAEKLVTELGAKNNFEVKCEKDGRVFINDDLTKYDAFVFETQGDLGKETSRDGFPPVPPEGKKKLLEAIAAGKGFVGCHCASDTYHSAGDRFQTQTGDKVDPYIAMLGGEFIRHGPQQRAWLKVVDANFPGLKGVNDFGLHEEWYSLKNFASDIHVILVQETAGMNGSDYERPNFPATWARMHQKGRVFYTSLGHREDVWTNPIFQQLLLGGLSWAVGNVNADIPPNLEKVAPKAGVMPPPPKK
jgi:hypothetical protein